MSSISFSAPLPNKRGVKLGTIRGKYKPRVSKLGVLGSTTLSTVKQEELIEDPSVYEINTSILFEVVEQDLTEEALKFGDIDDDPYNDHRSTKTKTNSYYDDNLAVIRNKALQQYGSFIRNRILREKTIKSKNNYYIDRALQKV